ncbi:MAG: L-serine ammonia-lyase, iron-sulfur-dependent, subunit alpha [Candidatus Aminicenantales bacterium]
MDSVSVFNDVIGPVMRGPSSSHTAGSYRIGRMARFLLGEKPVSVTFLFDPAGSYARTYREQGADLGFAAGFLEWSMTDERFPEALDWAARAGISFEFKVSPLPRAEHPNTVQIRMKDRSGREVNLEAQSVGGGLVVVTRLEGWEVHLTGKSFDLIIELERGRETSIEAILEEQKERIGAPLWQSDGDLALILARSRRPWNKVILEKMRGQQGVHRVWSLDPVFFVLRGEPLFSRASEMIAVANQLEGSLGRAALRYEAVLLGLSEAEVRAEMLRRWDVMVSAVDQGLRGEGLRMKLLKPSAERIFRAIGEGKVAVGGVQAKAATRAMAALHVSSSGGVVCAAPTGASSGVIPGVLVTLAEEKKLTAETIVRALFAAGGVGLVIAQRATFAAEIAGCQVEIGAAGAMAAAAVVEAVGGSAEQACAAASVALQNTMGSVCDLVQGICEIPCHTRTAAAAAHAFICADLILGGYKNLIPLDETVDAVFSVGKMLPPELRCTSCGGLALAPSALSLPRFNSPKSCG